MTSCVIASIAQKSGQILLWSGVLLLLIVVLSAGVWYYRRRWLSSDDTSTAPWTLDDIRRLRDEGKLTPDEYQALRATMIGALKADTHRAEKPTSPVKMGGSEPGGDDFDLQKGPYG